MFEFARRAVADRFGEDGLPQGERQLYCLSYISGQTQTLSLSLSKMEEVIRVAGDKEGPGQFTRLGRSLIINRKYLVGISVLRQCVMLSDCEGHTHVVQVPKMILKKFKDMIAGGRREFID